MKSRPPKVEVSLLAKLPNPHLLGEVCSASLKDSPCGISPAPMIEPAALEVTQAYLQAPLSLRDVSQFLQAPQLGLPAASHGWVSVAP